MLPILFAGGTERFQDKRNYFEKEIRRRSNHPVDDHLRPQVRITASRFNLIESVSHHTTVQALSPPRAHHMCIHGVGIVCVQYQSALVDNMSHLLGSDVLYDECWSELGKKRLVC